MWSCFPVNLSHNLIIAQPEEFRKVTEKLFFSPPQGTSFRTSAGFILEDIFHIDKGISPEGLLWYPRQHFDRTLGSL